MDTPRHPGRSLLVAVSTLCQHADLCQHTAPAARSSWSAHPSSGSAVGCVGGRSEHRNRHSIGPIESNRIGSGDANRRGISLSVVCVCVPVGLSVESGRGVDFPSWSPRSGVVCARWASGFPDSWEEDFGVSSIFFASLGRSVAVLVRVGRHSSFAFAESPLCASPPLPLVCSRPGSLGDGKRRCRGSALAITSRVCRLGSQCAVHVFR